MLRRGFTCINRRCTGISILKGDIKGLDDGFAGFMDASGAREKGGRDEEEGKDQQSQQDASVQPLQVDSKMAS